MNRHCLVTGGAGFIGSHLTEALLSRGDRVTVVDDLSTGRETNLETVQGHGRLNIITGDLGALAADVAIDVDEVYHLAAAVGVQLICQQTYESIERNVQPTRELLNVLREQRNSRRPAKLFLASSSEVYGNNPEPTWNEERQLVFGPSSQPRWSYGVSKLLDEFMALAAWQEYQVPVVVGRFFNVVGPRQTGTYGMVLPRLVAAATSGGPLVVHDDGQQTRCFAHVSDVVDAVIGLMGNDAATGQVFNIGSDRPVTILELAEQVIKTVGSELDIEFQSYQQAFGDNFQDVRHRVPDIRRLRTAIDYQPKFTLEAIIRELVSLATNQRN